MRICCCIVSDEHFVNMLMLCNMQCSPMLRSGMGLMFNILPAEHFRAHLFAE